MAHFEIQIQVPKVNPFNAAADALVPSTLLKLIGIRLTGFMADRFEADGAVPEFGLPGWQPLKPSTIALRRGGSSKPLQDTGQLRMSYQGQESDNQTYVEVGSNKQYASFHETGTAPYVIQAKSGKTLAAKLAGGGWMIFGKRVNHPGLPARPVLPAKSVAEQLMAEEVEEVLRTAAEDDSGGN